MPESLVESNLLRQTPMCASRLERLIALLLAAGCGAVLGVAAWLQPDPTGVGTHSQLGLAPCRWVEWAGMPCPTCGITTAFAHAADGRIDKAIVVQPMGALLAVLTAMTFWAGLYIAVTGSRIGHFLMRLRDTRVVWALAAMALASWLYKIWMYRESLA